MLHIHNGDSAANTAKQSSLAGEHFAWRESLITGPAPAGISDDEWRRVRARHLSSAYGESLQECERNLRQQEEKLAAFSEHDEVVLWFEHDLFCQLHLIYLLEWFSHQELGKTKLSLICIGEFPGKENFRGLGELNAAELFSLFPSRQPVTGNQLQLAEAAWQAYSAPDPTGIEKLLQTDTAPLPFLRAALQAHLERFPATSNGLGRIEKRALDLVHQGANTFADLFPGFSESDPIYGLGDAQFWLAVQNLIAINQPLLSAVGLVDERVHGRLTRDISKARFELTELGDTVRQGKADLITLNGFDAWLGGAYLHDGEGLWRWNYSTKALVFDPGEQV